MLKSQWWGEGEGAERAFKIEGFYVPFQSCQDSPTLSIQFYIRNFSLRSLNKILLYSEISPYTNAWRHSVMYWKDSKENNTSTLGKISRASGWTQNYDRKTCQKKDQLLGDTVTSKIRLRKGFWSTQSKLLFQTVTAIWGKARLRKIFQNGNPS